MWLAKRLYFPTAKENNTFDFNTDGLQQYLATHHEETMFALVRKATDSSSEFSEADFELLTKFSDGYSRDICYMVQHKEEIKHAFKIAEIGYELVPMKASS
jgi:hypothetical protein